jgi:hypothetical protein
MKLLFYITIGFDLVQVELFFVFLNHTTALQTAK